MKHLTQFTMFPAALVVVLGAMLFTTPAVAQSIAGKAVSFNGSNQYAQAPADVWFSSSFTIESWVCMRSGGWNTRLIDFANDAGTDNVFITLSSGDANILTFAVCRNGNFSYMRPPTTCQTPINRWFHLACTFDTTTGTGKIYVDGIQVASGPLNTPRNITRNNCYIARSNWPTDWYPNASFDELSIWNTARSNADIRGDMAHLLAGTETALEGYWHFDEGSGATANDASGHAKTVTLFNTPSWPVSTAPIYAAGAVFGATPAPLGLGNTYHTTAAGTITIRNTGTASMIVYNVVSRQGAVTVVPQYNVTVASGGTNPYSCSYAWSNPGSLNTLILDTLDFYTNLGSSAVPVNATAIGVPKRAISFNGSTQYATVPGGNWFTPNFSVTGWVYLRNYADQVPLIDFGRMVGSYTNDNVFVNLSGNGSTSGYARFCTMNGQTTSDLVPSVLTPTGRWFHLACTFTDTGNGWGVGKMYLDGYEIARGAMRTPTQSVTRSSCYIGNSAWSKHSNGIFDELTIWSKTLSPAEVRNTMLHTLTGSEANLAGYWQFDSTGYDGSNHGNTATFLNSPPWSTFVPPIFKTGPVFSSASSLDMGNVLAGTRHYDSLTVSNPGGTDTLVVSCAISRGGYLTVPYQGGIAVPPGSSRKVYCSYLCGFTGAMNDILDLYTNAGVNSVTVTANGMLPSPPIPPKAISFANPDNNNAANSYGKLPGGSWFSGSFSVESWVYLRNYNSWSRLIDFGNGAPGENVLIFLSDGSSGHIGIRADSGSSTNTVTTTTTATKNKWFHLAVTYDAPTRIATIYIDGVPVKTGWLYVPKNVIRDSCYVGRSNWNADSYTNATFDELTIWNRARSATEILSDMSHTLAGAETGLVGYWPLDSTGYDKSLHGNTIDFYNIKDTSWKSADAPIFRSGPAFTAIPSSADIGNVYPGTQHPDSLTVSNTAAGGNDSLVIYNVVSRNGTLTVPGRPNAAIQRGQSSKFYFTYQCDYITPEVKDTLDFYTSLGLRQVQVTGTANMPSPPIAKAISFTNPDEHNQAVDSYSKAPPGVWFNGSYTVEAWVFLRNYNNCSRLIDFGEGNSDGTGRRNNVYISLSEGTNGKIGFGTFKNGSVQLGSSTIQFPRSQWAHLACTFADQGNGSGTAKIYINGVLNTTFPMYTPKDTLRSKCVIAGIATSDNATDASIDELSIWNKTRSATEILNDMSHTLTGDETGLLGFWPFDSTGYDASKHGKTAFFYNTNRTAWQTDCPPHFKWGVGFSSAPSLLDMGNINPGTRHYDSVTVTNTGTHDSLFVYGLVSHNQVITVPGIPGTVRIPPGTTGTFYCSDSCLTTGDIRDTIDFYTNLGLVQVPVYAKGGYYPQPRAGTAVSLNGSNQFVAVKGGNWFSHPNFTVTAWVNLKDTTKSFQRLFDFGNGRYSNLVGMNLCYPASNGSHVLNFFMCRDSVTNTPTFTSNYHLQPNQWYHIACTYSDSGNGKGLVKIYVQGDSIASGVINASYPTRIVNTCLIGNSNWWNTEGYANAIIDEFSIWKKALSTADIRSIKNNSLAGNEDSLIGYWRFDEGTGIYDGDATNQGNTATLNNSPVWVRSGAPIVSVRREFSASPNPVIWKNLNPGTTKYGAVTVKNTGLDLLVIDSVKAIRGLLTVPIQKNVTIRPNQSFVYNFSYACTATGNITDTLIFYDYYRTASVPVNISCRYAVQSSPGMAIGLDGNSQYTKAPDQNWFSGGSFSVESWIKINSLKPNSRLIDFGGGADNVYIALDSNSTGRIQMGVKKSGVLKTLATDAAAPLNQWFHLACTFDSASKMGTIYLNGTAVKSAAALDRPNNVKRYKCFVGRDSSGTSYANAAFDEISIWNRVRTPDEIRNDQTHTLAGNEYTAGLLGYWRFDEGQDTVAGDASSHGTPLTGNPLALVNHPAWVQSGAPISTFSPTPFALDFESVNLDRSRMLPITVLNSSDSDIITISSAFLRTPYYTITPAGGVIQPGERTRFVVTFTPTRTGVLPDTAWFSDYTSGKTYWAPVTGTGVAGEMLVAPDTMRFGPVVIGVGGTDTLAVTNSSASAMVIKGINHQSPLFSISPVSAAIPPGGSQKFAVTFLPAALGPVNDVLTIIDSATALSRSVPVSGTGIQPVIHVDPLSLSFGSVSIGMSDTNTVMIWNSSGMTPFTITAVASDEPDYAPVTGSFTIQPGDTVHLQVVFTPASSGVIPGSLTFTHNAGGPPIVVAMSGTGMANPVNSVLAFGGDSLSRVDCGAGIDLRSRSFTFEFWARRDSVNTAEQVVLSQGNASSANNARFAAEFPASGVFSFSFGGDALTIPDAVWHPDTLWHHWAGTYDVETGKRIVYRDGVALGNDISTAGDTGSAGSFLIGAIGGAPAPFAGMLDEAQLWSGVRTPAQINTDMYTPVDHSSGSALAAWNFNEGSGTAVADISGHHHAGTLAGAVAFNRPRVSPPLLTTAADSVSEQYTLVKWRHIPMTDHLFRIFRTDPATNLTVQLTTLSSADSTYADYSGKRGNVYLYTVAMLDGNGAEVTRSADQGRTILFPPASFNASNGLYADKVVLSWTSLTTVTKSYEIYRNGLVLATVPGTSFTFNDPSATVGVSYTYRIDAIDSGGVRSQSLTASGMRAFVAPVSGLTASYGLYPHKVKVQWNAAAGPVARYRIYRDSVRIDSVASTVTSYTNNLPGTVPEKHTYAVAAIDTGGRISIWRFADGGINILPPPAGVLASDLTYDDHVEVTWSDTTALENHYLVFKDRILLATLPANSTKYLDYDSVGGINHIYWVRSSTDSGGMSFDTLTRDPGTQSIILAPTGFTATAGSNEDKIVLNWSTTSTRTNLFQMYRDGALLATVPSATHSYRDFNCTSDEPHRYVISAMTVDGIASSADTAEGQRVLQPPSGVSATDGDNEEYTHINWTNNSVAAKGIRVRRSLRDSSQMVTLTGSLYNGMLKGTDTTYDDSTGRSGIVYRYYVDVVDTIGGISYSASAFDFGSRLLKAPLSVAATDRTNEDNIAITWRDTSQAEDGYHVYRDGVLIASLQSNTTSYIDNVPPVHGVSFTYGVTAFDRYGESEQKTDAGATAIIAPTFFKASMSYTDRIQLTWMNGSGIQDRFFAITRTDSFGNILHIYTGGDSANFADLDATPGKQYLYAIRTAAIERGDTGYSAPDTCTGMMLSDAQGSAGVTSSTILVNTINAKIPKPADWFGRSVAMKGDFAIVSAPDTGITRDLEWLRNRNGSWYVIKTDASTFGNGRPDNYGVAMADSFCVAGDPLHSNVIIYRRTSADTTCWTKKSLDYSGQSVYKSGYAVAIQDSQFFLSEPWHDSTIAGQTYHGAVVTYTSTGVSNKKLMVPSVVTDSAFGLSLFAGDSLLAVGALGRHTSDGMYQPGAVYLFRKSRIGTFRWDSLSSFRIPRNSSSVPANIYSSFGSALGIYGKTLVVGSPNENAAWVYTLSPNFYDDQTVLDSRKLTPSDSLMVGRGFGSSVAIDGNNLLIGDQQEAVYHFVCVNGIWIEVEKFGADRTKSNHFGRAVAISCSKGLIGSDNSSNTQLSGAVYPFFLIGTPQSAAASDGQYQDRVHITWSIDAASLTGYKLYRDGDLIKTLGPENHEYDDYDALPGQPHLYGITAYVTQGQVTSQTTPAADYGWRSADGSITGRIMNKVGAGLPSIKVNIEPSPNKSLVFDGVQGSVHVGLDTAGTLIGSSSCTIEAWIKPTSANAGGIVGWGTSGSHLANELRLVGGNPVYDWGGGDILVVNPARDLRGGWHHVATTYDASSGIRKLYIDGDSVASDGGRSGNQATNRSINIGVGYDGAYFEGQIDEVRLWRVARTTAQIHDAMNIPLTGGETALAGYWPMDQSQGTIVPDLTHKTSYGRLSGGVYWSGDHAPLDMSAVSDSGGDYTVSNIPYGQTMTFKVIPTYDGHQFRPNSKAITLSRQSTVQNEVSFTDMTSFGISGHVMIGNCPVQDVEIYTDGTLTTRTDKNGFYALSHDPASSVIIAPKFHDHTFSKPIQDVKLTEDRMGVDFQNTKTYTLKGRAGGGCNRNMGTVTLEFSTPSHCFDTTVRVTGVYYSVILPAQKYYARVVSVDNVPVGLDRIAVRDFFAALGTREMDLTSISNGNTDTTMDFIYRAPLSVTISGLLPGSCNVPVLSSGTPYPIKITVVENYGNSVCPVDSGSLMIYDGIQDREDSALIIPIKNGVAYDTTIAGVPNISTGILDENGISRDYQKSLTVYANVPGLAPTKATTWAIVTGIKMRAGANFVTAHGQPFPLYILHDPPGDGSFTTLAKGISSNWSFHYDFSHSSFGMGPDIELSFGLSNELWTMAIFLAVGEVKAGNFLAINSSSRAGFEKDATYSNYWTVTTENEYSTSAAPDGVGADADVFIGAGINFIFTESDKIEVQNDCSIKKSKAIGFSPSGFNTQFMYTRRHIRDVLIPTLDSLIASTDLENNRFSNNIPVKDSLANVRSAFKKMLDDDDRNKMTASMDCNKSFSAGAEYMYSYQMDTTNHRDSSYSMYFESSNSIGYKCLMDWLGVENEDNLLVGVDGSYSQCNNDTPGEYFHDSTYVGTGGISYALSDDDPGDYFSVDICKSIDLNGGPTFRVRGGISSCPYEPWEGTISTEAATIWGPTMAKRDLLQAYVSPPVLENVNPDKPAVFAFAIANQSDETRTYDLWLDNTSNYGGAIVKASGIPINTGVPYTIEGGKTQNIVLSVERGPSKYRYDNLRLLVGPDCEEDRETLADAAVISVHFTSPCSDVELAEPSPGWKVIGSDSTLAVTFGGYQIDFSETDSVTQMWAEYRTVGQTIGPWTRLIGVEIPNAASLKDSAHAFRTWLLKDPNGYPLPDGSYEIRAVTLCPSGFGYSPNIPGSIDRTPPSMLSYQPANHVLAYGGDISVTFSENIDPHSINADSVSLVYSTGPLDPITVTAACSGATLILSAPDMRDGDLVTAAVSGVKDLNGNRLAVPAVWTFRVIRSGFRLSDDTLSFVRAWGSPGSFTIKASNGTSDSGSIRIVHIDANWMNWTTPADTAMTAKSSKTITFAFNPSVKRDTLYRQEIPFRFVKYSTPDTLRDTLVVSLRTTCMPPGWSVNAAAYANTMTVTAQVFFDGSADPDTNTNVVVEALCGSQIRGVTNLQQIGGRFGHAGFAFLTVYSNASSGEKIRFHVFNPANCQVYNIVTPSIAFVSGDIQGSPTSPIRLQASYLAADASLQVQANPGWTWFSYNMKLEDDATAGIFGTVSPSSGDIVKGLGAFSQYAASDTGDAGWYGSLLDFSYKNSYMAKLKAGGLISLSGNHLRPDTVSLPLSTGWNWIGYLPSGNLTPDQAFTNLGQSSTQNGELIMSQNQFAQYLYGSGGGWFGTLAGMRPGMGYRYHSNTNQTLHYPNPTAGAPAAAGAKAGEEDAPGTDEPLPAALTLAAGPGWSVDPSCYQYNMTITSMVDIDGTISVNDSDVVAAFVGDSCRGVTGAVYIPSLSRNEFFLMVFSNKSSGETVRFLYYDARRHQTRDVTEQAHFTTDATVGTIGSPYQLHAGAVLGIDGKPILPKAYALWQNYPNPFNPATIIRYDLPEESKVSLKVYNMLGQLVATIEDGIEPAGFKVKKFEAGAMGNGLASGVYFYRLEAKSITGSGKGLAQLKKMVVLK